MIQTLGAAADRSTGEHAFETMLRIGNALLEALKLRANRTPHAHRYRAEREVPGILGPRANLEPSRGFIFRSVYVGFGPDYSMEKNRNGMGWGVGKS